MPTRGIRNNNPGNLDKLPNGQHWSGEDPKGGDPRFAVFLTPEMGIRALVITLAHYQSWDHCRTIRQIINRFAPRTENDTDAYVRAVATACGVGTDYPISVLVPATMEALVRSIIQHENGVQPYTDDQIAMGLSLAKIGKE